MDFDALLDAGIGRLTDLLEGLTVSDLNPAEAPTVDVAQRSASVKGERLVTIQDLVQGGYSGPILVEARTSVTVALIDRDIRPRAELVRRLNTSTIVIVSPWLSPRSREYLDELGYGYVDLTGNIALSLRNPFVRLRLDGASRDPAGRGGDTGRRLGGARAGALVRALVDVRPPYTASDLVRATGLSNPYVSRLLAAMEEHGYVSRSGRVVDDVDWPALLRSRAEGAPPVTAGAIVGFVAGQGISDVMRRLGRLSGPAASLSAAGLLAVTGSAAAAAVAPLAVGSQLMLYLGEGADADLRESLTLQLGLLPRAIGADVLMIAPDDPSRLVGTRLVDGVPHVALSQVALDCLTGPGRMPAEGEEVLAVMAADQSTWRRSRLRDWI